MGRARKVDRTMQLNVRVRISIWEKVRAQLFSEIEGKVPFGATSALVERLFAEWLEKRGVE